MSANYSEIGNQPTRTGFFSHVRDTVGIKHTKPVGVSMIVNRSAETHERIFQGRHFWGIPDCLHVFLYRFRSLHSSTFRRRVYKLCDVAVILQRYKDTFKKEPVLMK